MSILKLTKVPAILAAAALSAAVPAKAVAQGVDLVPWAGAYIPTRNSVSDLDNALSRDVSPATSRPSDGGGSTPAGTL